MRLAVKQSAVRTNLQCGFGAHPLSIVVVAIVVMAVSRLLVCWQFVNQQLVIIVRFCTKNNNDDHCFMTVIVANNKRQTTLWSLALLSLSL